AHRPRRENGCRGRPGRGRRRLHHQTVRPERAARPPRSGIAPGPAPANPGGPGTRAGGGAAERQAIARTAADLRLVQENPGRSELLAARRGLHHFAFRGPGHPRHLPRLPQEGDGARPAITGTTRSETLIFSLQGQDGARSQPLRSRPVSPSTLTMLPSFAPCHTNATRKACRSFFRTVLSVVGVVARAAILPPRMISAVARRVG